MAENAPKTEVEPSDTTKPVTPTAKETPITSPAQAVEPTSPSIGEFRKWLGYHLARDWPVMVKAPIAFFAVFALSLLAFYLFLWKIVVPEKNEQITTKQGIIDSKQERIDRLTAERDDARSEKAALQTASANVMTVVSNLYTIVSNTVLLVSATTPKGNVGETPIAAARIPVIAPSLPTTLNPPTQNTTAPNPVPPSEVVKAQPDFGGAGITNLDDLAQELRDAKSRFAAQKEHEQHAQYYSDIDQLKARLPFFNRAIDYIRLALGNLAIQSTNSLIDTLMPISVVVTSRLDLGSITVGTKSPLSFNVYINRLQNLTAQDGPELVIEYRNSSPAVGTRLSFSINNSQDIGELQTSDGYVHRETLSSSDSNDISVVRRSIGFLLAVPSSTPAIKGQ